MATVGEVSGVAVQSAGLGALVGHEADALGPGGGSRNVGLDLSATPGAVSWTEALLQPE